MANSVLRQTVHTSLARTLLNEVLTRSVKYYFSYGKTDAWPDSDTVPQALDTLDYELIARKNSVFMKEVAPNDVSLVISRVNWVSGSVYDDYDAYSPNNVALSGATTLEDALFYVVTDEFNVYKCLFNNNGGSSTVKPTGTSASPFQTADFYIWKFMYSIPTALRNKFLSSTQMPVVTALTNAFYSDGKIEKFTISAKGSGYYPNQQLPGTVITAAGQTNYRIITGVGTSFLTNTDTTLRLTAGDYVVIDGEVRVVASVQSDTQFTIRSQDPFLRLPASTKVTKINTYLELTSGDGYRESNPYIVTGVQITDGGSNYTSGQVSVVFTAPPATGINNRTAAGTAVVNGSGVITGVTLTDCGYGYTIPPKVSFVRLDSSSGNEATATSTTIKSEAYLEPVINSTTGEITNVQVVDPGIGYTYANIAVRRVKVRTPPAGTTYTDASVSVDVTTGKIDSQQATVEAAAINGGIHVIKLTDFGSGYTSATVTVSGDGTGCTATPVIINGQIVRITVTNPGKDYTYATVAITTSQSPSQVAYARPIISPSGGHGRNAVDELFGRTILFYNRLDVTPIMGVSLDVDFRQLCLYKQPKTFDSALLFNGYIGSTCYRTVLETSNKPALSNIALGTELRVYPNSSSTVGVLFKVIGRSSKELLLQNLDNNDEQVKAGYVVRFSNSTLGTINYTISILQKPDVEKLRGEIIYIDNRQPFRALTDQPVSISSRFRL